MFQRWRHSAQIKTLLKDVCFCCQTGQIYTKDADLNKLFVMFCMFSITLVAFTLIALVTIKLKSVKRNEITIREKNNPARFKLVTLFVQFFINLQLYIYVNTNSYVHLSQYNNCWSVFFKNTTQIITHTQIEVVVTEYSYTTH